MVSCQVIQDWVDGVNYFTSARKRAQSHKLEPYEERPIKRLRRDSGAIVNTSAHANSGNGDTLYSMPSTPPMTSTNSSVPRKRGSDDLDSGADEVRSELETADELIPGYAFRSPSRKSEDALTTYFRLESVVRAASLVFGSDPETQGSHKPVVARFEAVKGATIVGTAISLIQQSDTGQSKPSLACSVSSSSVDSSAKDSTDTSADQDCGVGPNAVRSSSASQKVNYVLRLVMYLSEEEPLRQAIWKHSSEEKLQYGYLLRNLLHDPIAVSIETKTTSSCQDPMLQLGLWTAAWYKRMNMIYERIFPAASQPYFAPSGDTIPDSHLALPMAETAPSIPDQPPAPAHASTSRSASQADGSSLPLPRVTIRFCTQCKWMLRAAYFAQELLSTFSTSLGEVALQPATGGIFVVEIHYADPTSTAITSAATTQTDPNPTIQRRVLWDRKVDGGFPETKELKRRVRDVIEPDRDLGHVDRDYPKQQQPQPNKPESSQSTVQGQQTISDLSQTGSQSEAPGDLGPLKHKTIDADGPVQDTRIPVMPPVAHDSRSNIQDLSSQAHPQTQKTQEECEDCQ
ncbi:Rdx family-domain-containing protein [Xylaria castorea]|nr:Rdx family-domain-containing protein [Xylaria castorea]